MQAAGGEESEAADGRVSLIDVAETADGVPWRAVHISGCYDDVEAGRR